MRWGDDFQIRQATKRRGDGGGRAGARERQRPGGAAGRRQPRPARREARAADQRRRPARAGSRALHRREHVSEPRGARAKRRHLYECVHARPVGLVPGPRRARDGRLAEDGRPVLRRVLRPQPVCAERHDLLGQAGLERGVRRDDRHRRDERRRARAPRRRRRVQPAGDSAREGRRPLRAGLPARLPEDQHGVRGRQGRRAERVHRVGRQARVGLRLAERPVRHGRRRSDAHRDQLDRPGHQQPVHRRLFAHRALRQPARAGADQPDRRPRFDRRQDGAGADAVWRELPDAQRRAEGAGREGRRLSRCELHAERPGRECDHLRRRRDRPHRQPS